MVDERYVSAAEEQTLQIGQEIGTRLKAGAIVSLKGPLGAGKTVIAKGIALALGITEPVTSPTYTLISEYQGRVPLYHMDLYRIDSIDDFEMIGAEELLYGDGISLIEWSEKIDELLPDDCIRIIITIGERSERMITVKGLCT
ncbi:MAG: tRNA (adenosine(37)-N6)-threonylcarbamoyltransferase complex ATPase subunit type 1 TsaE [Spirochaetia bacterium]|nr:tRNA (adenosine(37)-N6)-threonylcarbamoyltransferase complex ATPase subunit type 1 TsaE [Spirochaetia bacterium]MCF7941031.1 tRNA (adenosine(37)-N6)-threonylcarbamoyltransferase complex ATPase subunit type 1 TsaE [Spirochaetia bacterium]